jgi:hypothetical protein
MFVRQGNKLVNVASATTIDIGPLGTRGKRQLTLRDAKGNVLAETNDDILPALENPDHSVIIAGPVTVVVIDDAGTVTWASVIAWRLAPHSSTGDPIFAVSRPEGHMFMVTKDGALLGLGGKMFKSIDAAVKTIQAAASLASVEIQ